MLYNQFCNLHGCTLNRGNFILIKDNMWVFCFNCHNSPLLSRLQRIQSPYIYQFTLWSTQSVFIVTEKSKRFNSRQQFSVKYQAYAHPAGLENPAYRDRRDILVSHLSRMRKGPKVLSTAAVIISVFAPFGDLNSPTRSPNSLYAVFSVKRT